MIRKDIIAGGEHWLPKWMRRGICAVALIGVLAGAVDHGQTTTAQTSDIDTPPTSTAQRDLYLPLITKTTEHIAILAATVFLDTNALHELLIDNNRIPVSATANFFNPDTQELTIITAGHAGCHLSDNSDNCSNSKITQMKVTTEEAAGIRVAGRGFVCRDTTGGDGLDFGIFALTAANPSEKPLLHTGTLPVVDNTYPSISAPGYSVRRDADSTALITAVGTTTHISSTLTEVNVTGGNLRCDEKKGTSGAGYVEWKSTGPTTQLAQTGIYVHELPNDGCEDTPPQVKKLEVSVVSLETSPQCQYQEWQAAADPSEIAGSAGSDQVAQQPIFVQLETGQLSAIHSQE